MTVAPKRNRRREAIIDAARLGGSKGTLYNYFGNKEELLEALVRDFCTRWACTCCRDVEQTWGSES